ncbi:helix-turn-helix domain-containing protein [Brevibacillus sp. NPDC003359]|uniref:MerR family transcriptional regulator n=1 Tax=unclassified Brevibacillus TaxID=2684853 RepID=UPI0036843E10
MTDWGFSMFKISEFSRLSRVSLKTLRFYDQIGILKPADIDKETGYRFYAAEQLVTLNRILMYKDLGFTLQQIQQLLHEDMSMEQRQGILRLKEREIELLLEEEQARLNRIKERLLWIEQKGYVEQEVVFKRVEPQKVVSFRSEGTVEEIPMLFDRLAHYAGKQQRGMLSPIVLWKESERDEAAFELEIGYVLKQDIALPSDVLEVRMLPEEPMMATLVQRVEPFVPSTACIDLAKWIERNQYRIKKDQPGRENYLQSPHGGDTYVEVQIPIESP